MCVHAIVFFVCFCFYLLNKHIFCFAKNMFMLVCWLTKVLNVWKTKESRSTSIRKMYEKGTSRKIHISNSSV